MKKEEFEIEDLINVLSKHGLTELTYESEENLLITIKKEPQTKENKINAQPKKVKENIKNDTNIISVMSTEIGKYFYKDFIKVGESVKVGQVIGNIHIMGLKNPLKSTKNGIIQEICVVDGEAVDYGKILLKLKIVAK